MELEREPNPEDIVREIQQTHPDCYEAICTLAVTSFERAHYAVGTLSARDSYDTLYLHPIGRLVRQLREAQIPRKNVRPVVWSVIDGAYKDKPLKERVWRGTLIMGTWKKVGDTMPRQAA